MSGFKTVAVLLGADVADAGTFTVAYPAGSYVGDFNFARGHYLMLNGKKLRQPADIGLSFGATSVTVTNRTGGVLPSGSSGQMQLEISGADAGLYGRATNSEAPKRILRANKVHTLKIVLGAPITADADGFCASQDLTSAGVFSVNTTAAAAIAAAALAGTADAPRNVVAAWTGTAVLTITGKDEYGQTVVESSASGTSLTGVKAFKTVTGISSSANITALTVGTGDVLGLPVALPSATVGNVLKEIQDDAVATAGTVVAALTKNTESTATSADVRGTYDPNAACDGAKSFALIVTVADPEDLGNPQYAG